MLTLNHIIERNPDLIHANIDNETMLMSLTNGEYYGMNKVGSAIWGLLEDSISVGTLIEKLTNSYEITTAECEKDINSFLDKLQEKGIIKIKE